MPMPTAHTIATFVVVCVASSTLAEYGRKLQLPLITGYILAGILCGPYMVGLLKAGECKLLVHLVTNDAMGFIGGVASGFFANST